MTNDETSFMLSLSNAELQWLAGAMGLARLPLQLEAKRADVPAAQASLQQKNLIQRANAGWQVDRLPAAIVRWLGTAEWMIAVTSYSREGTTRQLHIFIEQKLGLSAEMEADSVSFTLFPDTTALMGFLQNWINASFPDGGTDSVTYQLPQPETVLRAAWRDRKIAAEILKVAGIDSAQSKSTIKWLDSLQWTVTLSRVRLEADRPKAESQIILCGGGQKVWVGSDVLPPNEIIALTPASSKQVKALIQHLL